MRRRDISLQHCTSFTYFDGPSQRINLSIDIGTWNNDIHHLTITKQNRWMRFAISQMLECLEEIEMSSENGNTIDEKYSELGK